MKRQWRTLAGAVLLLGVCSGIGIRDQAYAQTPVATSGKELIAVLEFEPVGASKIEASAMTDRLGEELLKSGKFIVVDRAQIESVLKEQALQQTGCTSQECAVQVGKMLGVRKLVSGKVTKLSADLWLLASTMVDVQTSETLRSETVRHHGDLGSLLEVPIAALAAKLAGVQVAAATAPAAVIALPAPTVVSTLPPNKWVERASMATARYGLAAAALDGKVYAIGGNLGPVGTNRFVAASEVYDPIADKWSKLPDLPAPRAYARAAAAGGKIYVFGGRVNSSDPRLTSAAEAFDPASAAWSKLAPMPTPRDYPVAVTLGGLIYVIGGEDSKGATAVVEVFDPASNSWKSRASLKHPRRGAAGAAINGKIYVAGGLTGSFPRFYSIVNSVEEYDPAGDRWSEKAAMEDKVVFAVGEAINGKLYIGCGVDGNNRLRTSTLVFDPALNRWDSAPDSSRRGGAISAFANGGIYVMGGNTSGGVVATMEAYRPVQ